MKKRLALIPARSGSKALPHKNIALLLGKPLLQYTVEAARASGMFDEVVVSTDSEQYAGIAREAGAAVPFLRAAEFSGDAVPLSDVTLHVLSKLAAAGEQYEYCCVLQPTCPLRDARDIQNACEIMDEKNADAVVSVYESKNPWYTGGALPRDLSLRNFIKTPYRNVQRQDMKKFYALSGAICLLRVAAYLKSKNIFTARSYAAVLSAEHAFDIDTSADFACARALLELEQEARK